LKIRQFYVTLDYPSVLIGVNGAEYLSDNFDNPDAYFLRIKPCGLPSESVPKHVIL
jgi:hypothetical protein